MSATIAGTEITPSSGAYVGYNVVIQVAGEEVARVQRIDYNVNNNVIQIPVVSSRTVLNLPTRMIIRGSIRQVYFNTAMLRLTMGKPPGDVKRHGSHTSAEEIAGWMGLADVTPSFTTPEDFRRLPEVTISCTLNIEDSSYDVYHAVTLRGVVLDTYSMTITPNDVILENLSFFAETIGISEMVGLSGPVETPE